MPQRTNDFQRLILQIHQALGGFADIKESEMVPDRVTGSMREVDIWITSTQHGYPLNLAIECTDKSRPETVMWVEQQITKHSDLPTDKLILVSKRGFSHDALIKATHAKHLAISLSQAERTSWKGVLQKRWNLLNYNWVEWKQIGMFIEYAKNGNTVEAELLPHDVFMEASVADLMTRFQEQKIYFDSFESYMVKSGMINEVNRMEIVIPTPQGSCYREPEGDFPVTRIALHWDVAVMRKAFPMKASSLGEKLIAHGSLPMGDTAVVVQSGNDQGLIATVSGPLSGGFQARWRSSALFEVDFTTGIVHSDKWFSEAPAGKPKREV